MKSVIQIVEDATAGTESRKSVMGHPTGFNIEESADDSNIESGEASSI